MLEKQLRMKVEDVLADIEEDKLDRLDHVGPNRAEGKALNVRIVDFEDPSRHSLQPDLNIRRIGRIEWRCDRLCSLMQH